MIKYMYIALRQGLTTPWEWNLDINRNILSVRSFVASLKKISLKSDLKKKIMILYTYIAPKQRQTAPRGQRGQQKMSCHLIDLLQISKKCLWNLISYNFFHDLIHVLQKHKGPNLTLPYNRSRSTRVIIWANLVVLEHPIMHTKFQGHQLFGSRKDFLRFLPYMGMAAIMVMWPGPFEQTLVPPSHRSSIWNLTGPVVSAEKMFKECGRWRTIEAYLSYKLTQWAFSSCEPKNVILWDTHFHVSGQEMVLGHFQCRSFQLIWLFVLTTVLGGLFWGCILPKHKQILITKANVISMQS